MQRINTDSIITSRGVCVGLFTLLLSVYSYCVVAEDSTDLTQADEKLESTVVVGSTNHAPESLIEIDLQSYTGFAKVIDRSQFEYSYASFGELLNQLPGIQVRRTGGFGSLHSVSIRGSASRHVNYFLDGMLLNSPGSGAVNIQYIPTALVERVEVYPDFTPIKLANANLAGAINFRSRRLRPGDRGGQVKLAHGSFNTSHAEFSGWADINGWSSMVSINAGHSDNDFSVEEELFATKSSTRQNDGFEVNNLFFKLGNPGISFNSNTIIQYVDAEKELATTLNRKRDDASLKNESWRIQTIIDHGSDNWQFAHKISVIQEVYNLLDLNSTIGLNANLLEAVHNGFGLFNYAEYSNSNHKFQVALDLRYEDSEREDFLVSSLSAKGDRRVITLLLGDEWHLGQDLLIATSARYYWVEEKAELESVFEEDSSGITKEPNFEIGLHWDATENFLLKVNMGRLTRLPTLYEKYGSQGIYDGDPSLRPETAKAFDTGFEYDFGNIQLSSSLFHKKSEDEIVTVYNSQGIGGPTNLGSTKKTGIESKITWRVNDWLSTSAQTTHIDTENLSKIKESRGKQIPGIYHHSYGFSLDINKPSTHFTLAYNLDDELYYISSNTAEADTRKDLYMAITFFLRDFSINVAGRNLLNTNFLDYNKLPSPGRSLITTISLDF